MIASGEYSKSTNPARATRILIVGGDADGNLGDRAILQSMCLELRRWSPGVELSVVAQDGSVLGSRLDVEVIPRGFLGLARLCEVAARADMVLCGGGGLFQDDDSLIKMPYWGLRVGFLRLFCPRIVGYSLGVGPLRSRSSRLFARLAFACMERISVRDAKARQTARALTRRPVEMVPDPALLLPPGDANLAAEWLRAHDVPLDGRPLVGVAVRRWFPPAPRWIPHRVRTALRGGVVPRSDDSHRLTTLLAATLDQIVERHDAHVVFLPTYTVAHEADDAMCHEILEKMKSDAGSVVLVDDPQLYQGVARHLAVLLGGRMHPTIFASTVGTPVVGLSYNPKFLGFFDLLGDRERVLDVEEFVRGGLVSRLVSLVDSAMTTGQDPGDRSEAWRERIESFNRGILGEAA